MKIRLLPFTMMSAISSRASSGCSGPYPSTSLQMSSSSSSCSAVDIDDLFGGDDFADDVADFCARLVDVHLGQLGDVDDLDQKAEDPPLQIVVFVGLDSLICQLWRLWAGAGKRGRALSDCFAATSPAPNHRSAQVALERRLRKSISPAEHEL